MKEISEKVLQFRADRHWNIEQDAKDLALSVSLEASELLEIFQWKSGRQAALHHEEELQEEMADVLIYLIALADHLHIDLEAAVENKLIKNLVKYPLPEK